MVGIEGTESVSILEIQMFISSTYGFIGVIISVIRHKREVLEIYSWIIHMRGGSTVAVGRMQIIIEAIGRGSEWA